MSRRVLLLAVSAVAVVRGKYMEGELNTGENWSFLARFCFLSLSGMFEYDIEYPEVGPTIFSINIHLNAQKSYLLLIFISSRRKLIKTYPPD